MWPRSTGLSLDDTSMSGTLLMLVIDDDVDDVPDELPDDELTIGGGFAVFPLINDLLADEPASFSCVSGIGVLRLSFGDVCGL
jgi:hypothetical protein